MSDLVNKIKKFGYWKIIIRTADNDAEPIKDLSSCKDFITQSAIQLRGWDYPHIDHNDGIRMSGNKTLDSYCDWPEGPMYEYWRFYLSRQFVHYFAMREDLRIPPEKIKAIQDFLPTKSDKFLDIISTIYSCTEILRFTSNMAALGVFGKRIQIIVELGNIKDRVLIFWDTHGRYLSREYKCNFQNENIVITMEKETDEIIGNMNEIALDVALEIFNKFGWGEVSKDTFREDQAKLLERRR